jgi:hypothetical protein
MGMADRQHGDLVGGTGPHRRSPDMSAVIVPFPRNARALSERLRAVRNAIAERAKEVGATTEQKNRAQALALRVMDAGCSAGWALVKAKEILPHPKMQVYRQPQPPKDAAWCSPPSSSACASASRWALPC